MEHGYIQRDFLHTRRIDGNSRRRRLSGSHLFSLADSLCDWSCHIMTILTVGNERIRRTRYLEPPQRDLPFLAFPHLSQFRRLLQYIHGGGYHLLSWNQYFHV